MTWKRSTPRLALVGALLAALLPTLFLSATVARADSIPDEIYAGVSPSIVQIVTSSGAGSGVKVAQGVLTNAHVVGDASQVTIFTTVGREYSATVLKRDTRRDLALLETQAFLPAMSLSPSRNNRQGQQVAILGYPRPSALGVGGGTPTISVGMISNFRDLDGVLHLQTDAAMNSGNSGGAMVNMAGQLIGIARMGIRDSEGLNFAVASEEVISFLGSSSTVPTPRPLPTRG